MDARLAYHVNKSLGIAFGKIFEWLDLTTVRKDRLYQIDTIVRRKGGVDQLFPGGRVARRENAVSSRTDDTGTSEGPTSQGGLARPPRLLGASEGLRPSTV